MLSNLHLLIKALVSSLDVGFIAAGMKVSIKIYTFEFQKYGIIDGELTHVSRESIEDQNMGLMYETLARPERVSLMVDGQETDMRVDARSFNITARILVSTH
jgi:hemolysin D